MHRNFLLYALFIALSGSVWADDAVEAASAGGIVFEKTKEIIMQDETLTIKKSSGKNFNEASFSIHVDFHFKNISDHNITRKIAFAFPPVICNDSINTMWGGLEQISNGEVTNRGLRDFTVTVDSKPITYTKKMEAHLGQKNITDLLVKLNIPLNPCLIKIGTDNKPNAAYYDHLQKHHLLTEENFPAWQEHIYFEWTQNFPAGKVVHIQHHYTPVIGQKVPSVYSVNDLNDWYKLENPPLKPLWNYSPQRLAESHPTIVNKDKSIYPDEHIDRFCLVPMWIRYRLTTGAYWKEGIGMFKLIITDDSGAPFAVNQFGKNAAIKTSINKNSMTFITKKFIPKEDLLILFLSLPQSNEDLKVCGFKIDKDRGNAG